MDVVRVYVGCDHAGFSLRNNLVTRLRAQGRQIVDLGTDSEAACDYPEIASAVANSVRGDPGSLGILVCATGQGMAIAAGKVRGIRAVVPATVEAARLSRFDNDANVLCLGGRLLSEKEAFAIVDTWLATGFAGGRHARRIAKVAAIETASAVAFATESERLDLVARGIPGSIWKRDPTVFPVGAARSQARNALAWLSLPDEMEARLPEIAKLVDEVRIAGFKDVVLLTGTERKSTVAAVNRLWGAGAIRLHFLDGSPLATVNDLEKSLHLDTTLVLTVSTSDASSAIEVSESQLWQKFLDRCDGDAQRAGQHFAAITTPGNSLEQIARAHRYRATFLDPADIGECFGALGFVGLVPAALLGLDLARLLARAKTMAETCRGDQLESNPGTSLGVLLGAMAKHGRNKVTILASPSLLSLGPWISQLLSASTRDCGRGIISTAGETLLDRYPPDRVFVQLQAANDPPAISTEQQEALHLAGHPFIQIGLRDKYDLAAEIFRWEMSATVAAVVLNANPFVPMISKGIEQDPRVAAT